MWLIRYYQLLPRCQWHQLASSVTPVELVEWVVEGMFSALFQGGVSVFVRMHAGTAWECHRKTRAGFMVTVCNGDYGMSGFES